MSGLAQEQGREPVREPGPEDAAGDEAEKDAATVAAADALAPERIADVILALAAARGSEKSFCPSEAARVLAAHSWEDAAPGAPGDEAWRALMGPVRRAAARLAAEGRLRVLRKGRAVDPLNARGPIRLAAPR